MIISHVPAYNFEFMVHQVNVYDCKADEQTDRQKGGKTELGTDCYVKIGGWAGRASKNGSFNRFLVSWTNRLMEGRTDSLWSYKSPLVIIIAFQTSTNDTSLWRFCRVAASQLLPLSD